MRYFLLFSLLVLLAGSVFAGGKPDITVASDGTGDVKTVTDAIAKVPENNKKRFVILIKNGVYDEQVRVPATKPFVTFLGESAEKTILRFNINNKRAGSTSAAFAVYLGGADFRAENITFENSFEFVPGGVGSQAVAVLADADRMTFKNCRFLGWQDTLYARNGRQYYENSYIEGGVDFIFGRAAAVFEKCTIHSKSDGYIAAPMRFSDDETSGLIFVDSKLTGKDTKSGVFLARPWRPFGRTVFIDTEMGAHIRPEGWNNWGSADNEKTAYFAEFGSKGAGATPDKRVAWMHRLTAAEADKFRAENFLKGDDNWNPKAPTDAAKPKRASLSFDEINRQQPYWFETDEAAQIADQIVAYQNDNGGWEKNIDMAAMLTFAETAKLVKKKSAAAETTIDNKATYSQLEFLAKMITGSLRKKTPPTNFESHKAAFYKGLDYLFAAQYPNGGWPQFYPLKKGYYTHITFNDDAMIGVLELLRDVAQKKDDYKFVDETYRARAEASVAKALPVILKTQVVVAGKKTVWCQQYDEKTLELAPARKFEPISLTSRESASIVRYLMAIRNPEPEVVSAIEAAVEWLKANRIDGIRWDRKNGESTVVKDKNAPAMWARFYEIPTMRPIFLGRDSVVHYDVSEIEAERRNGYAWYVSEPRNVVEKEYPKWKARIAEKK